MSALGKYSKKISYHSILEEAHKKNEESLDNDNLKTNAKRLQEILTEIKQTANMLAKGETIMEDSLYSQYVDLIENTMKVQNLSRGKNQLRSIGALFHRKHKGISTIKNADDIFEEELAAMLTALEGGTNITIHLTGNQSADTAAINALTDSTSNSIVKAIQELEQKFLNQVKTKQIQKGKSQKIDIKGYQSELTFSIDIPKNLKELAILMKDATFSAKNYTSRNKDGLDEVNLHFGNTNLYKAITGTLSEAYSDIKDQRDIFYRGAQTIIKVINLPSSATKEEVIQHYAHMRFIYELRGSGLMTQSGESGLVKYIIYNDPYSNAIFVKDTATLIKEQFASNRNFKLFGGVSISANNISSL